MEFINYGSITHIVVIEKLEYDGQKTHMAPFAMREGRG
jgi:hypothetical protein